MGSSGALGARNGSGELRQFALSVSSGSPEAVRHFDVLQDFHAVGGITLGLFGPLPAVSGTDRGGSAQNLRNPMRCCC